MSLAKPCQEAPSQHGIAPNTFDASEVSSDLVSDYINDIYSRANILVTPKPQSGGANTTKSRYWDLRETNLLKSYSHGHIGRFIKSQDFIGIRKYYSGFVRLIHPDGSIQPAPGDVVVTDYREIGVFEVQNLDSFTAVIPIDILGLDVNRLILPRCFASDTTECRLISGAMDLWQRTLRHMHSADIPMLEASLISLIRSVLAHGRSAADRNADAAVARSAAIRTFIEANLANETLGVSLICREFNASRSTVYREFEDEGGVHRHIARRRMEIAANRLASGQRVRGRIGEVASSVGYADQFHFSKTFRRHLGFSPSDALDLADPST